MSSPAKPSTAGIVHDAASQQRVIPESRRADGSIRKERKVRPGFTPVEDVARFRSARRQQAEEQQKKQGASSVPVQGSTIAAAAALSSKPELKAVKPQAEPKQPEAPKRSWAGSRLRTQAKLAPAADPVPDSWNKDDAVGDQKAPQASAKDAAADDLSAQLDKLALSTPPN